jgi:hypothetical protein
MSSFCYFERLANLLLLYQLEDNFYLKIFIPPAEPVVYCAKATKKSPRHCRGDFLTFNANRELLAGSHLREALAAIHRAICLRLKGNTSFAAAHCAGGYEILAGCTGSVLARVAAALAALGLILEAALCVKLLLTGGENEILSAFFAFECLVLVHCLYLT